MEIGTLRKSANRVLSAVLCDNIKRFAGSTNVGKGCGVDANMIFVTVEGVWENAVLKANELAFFSAVVRRVVNARASVGVTEKV